MYFYLFYFVDIQTKPFNTPLSAEADVDYTPLPETTKVTFGPRETSKSVQISIIPDNNPESTEYFEVELIDDDSDCDISGIRSVRIGIRDDDGKNMFPCPYAVS